MSAREIGFRDLEFLPPHPENAGVAICWMTGSAIVLCLMAVVLVWKSSRDDGHAPTAVRTSSGCALVTFPNAGVPYQSGYQCADGTIYYQDRLGG
jgi:hypothetical protein